MQVQILIQQETNFLKIFVYIEYQMCFNLITKDLIKHPFAAKNIQQCKSLIAYFKKSYLPNNLLPTKITEKNIIGGGLKTYINI